jgi:hypothetical protein
MPGIIVADDISDGMKAELIVEEVLGLAHPKYNLRPFARVIDTGTKRSGKWPVSTKLAGHEKVPPLVEAPLSAQAYQDIDFELWKNVVHVAISREAEMESKVDIMRMNTKDAARDLARMENKQIAEVITGFTDVPGGDWTGTDSPLDDIMPLVAVIQDLGYDPNALIMQSQVYAYFLANENIKEVYERGAVVARGGIQMLGNLKIAAESSLVAETAFLADTEAPAIALFDGPSIVEQYTMQAKFARGYAIAKFLQPYKVLDDAGREMTGLLS